MLDDAFFAKFSDTRVATLKLLVSAAVANKDAADVDLALGLLKKSPGELLWWKPAFLQSLGKATGSAAAEVAALQSKIDSIVLDDKAAPDQRVAVLPLLGTRKWEAVQPIVKQLLTSSQAPELTSATLGLLKRFAATSTAPLIYELLPSAGPVLKRELVPILTGNATTALAFFKRMEKGEFPTAWVDIETRWRYQRGKGEMTDLAKKLFGEASGDRAAVVTDYLSAAPKARRRNQGPASLCHHLHRLSQARQGGR